VLCAQSVLGQGAPALSAASLRTNLLFWRGPVGNLLPVTSKDQWRLRRAEIIHNMEQVMGSLPGEQKRCPLEVKIESETNCGAYVRRQITYASEPGSRTPAFLLIPKEALTGGGRKFPAVLALHPTDPDYGHRVVVEQLRDHYRAYARDLAVRGYVMLAPAYPLMANYQPDLKALGYQSGTMKAIWDNIRGLDLLESLPFVKKRGIGAIGHSLGGHNAIYTAVFDERIAVVVSSCGFDSFLDYGAGDPVNWTAGRGWCQERYMPKLAEYRGRLAEIPFDFYELIAALAPRPVFINAPLGDTNFKAASVDRIVNAASQIYRLYGVPRNLQVEHPDGGHDFPPGIREEAYKFLDENLR
jgi:hypothetical protein